MPPPPSGGIRNPITSKRAAAHLHLRPRGHWDLRQTSNNTCEERNVNIVLLIYYRVIVYVL